MSSRELTPVVVRQATCEDHRALVALARCSSYTRDFSSHFFSGEEHYARGWIRVAVGPRGPVGFTCFRKKSRAPETKLYFLVVAPEHRRGGLGRLLMKDLEAASDNPRVVLDCHKENPACLFYERLGYVKMGESLGGKGNCYVKEW